MGNRQPQSFANNGYYNKEMAGHHCCSLFISVNYVANSWPNSVAQINQALATGHSFRALPLSPLKQEIAKIGAKFSYSYTFKLTDLKFLQIRLDLYRQLMVIGNSLCCVQRTFQWAGIDGSYFCFLQRYPQALCLFSSYLV